MHRKMVNTRRFDCMEATPNNARDTRECFTRHHRHLFCRRPELIAQPIPDHFHRYAATFKAHPVKIIQEFVIFYATCIQSPNMIKQYSEIYKSTPWYNITLSTQIELRSVITRIIAKYINTRSD